MATGTVKWFSSEKGYGFITPDEGGVDRKDLFVHYTAIQGGDPGQKNLAEGQRVEYESQDTDKGKKAINVIVLAQ